MTHRELEAKLGHVFSEPTLLIQALTHRSFGVPHNERLEFLGDSVLNCAIAKLIYEHYPVMPEGELSRLRSNLVNQAELAEIASELELGVLMRLGEGELKTGGASRPSILADAVEALFGATFLDAGFDKAADAVGRLYATRIAAADESRPAKDAKTALQEWLQARRLPLPRYTVLKIEGEAHRQNFHVRCDVESQGVAVVGQGHNRRTAEQVAAAEAFAAVNDPSTGRLA